LQRGELPLQTFRQGNFVVALVIRHAMAR
jgi:hypothetical protein